MKKVFTLLVFLLSATCFSQVIKVSTTKYTVDQLVNTVLINSPCIYTSDVKSRTGTDFSSSNGIGFFENTNPKFPMKSGVILSTGDVLNAKGPNPSTPILSDGSDEWIGDTDLENTLAKAGIAMTSKNASVIEFDFTPISSKFSFEFLFASEEYGNSQCDFSDAFAFLLTNTKTGETTNLAVVPNTTTPISVVTIRNMLYNSSCSSQNKEYFGRFNGGSEADNSATNFNGQTVLLNASATLDINQIYHIKLVIADRGDTKFDSAIFIASDTFNIGQNVLGTDITISNGKAPCNNSSYVLDSELNTVDFKINWYKDGQIISGQNDSKLTVSTAGKYTISYQKNGCSAITDDVIVEFQPEFATKNPIDLYKCNGNASSYIFELSLNTSRLKTGLDPLTEISYHSTLSDANNNTNSLPLTYTSTQNTETIYARIKSPGNECFVVRNFKLLLIPPPEAKNPGELSVCSNSNTSSFNLITQDQTILNGLSPIIYAVKYFNTLNDAQTGLNAITSSGSFVSGNATIFARVENKTDSTCFNTTSFNLKINLNPVVDMVGNIETCDEYALAPLTNGNYFTQPNGEGTPLFAGDMIYNTQDIYIFNKDVNTGCASNSSFNIKIIPKDYKLAPDSGNYCGNYYLPSLEFGDYFTKPDGLGSLIPFGTSIKISQPIYVYFKANVEPFCVRQENFNVGVFNDLQLDAVNNVFNCNSYTLPTLSTGNYFTASKGGGTPLNAGDKITSSQTIYIYAISPEGCEFQKSFQVLIGLDYNDISQCQPYSLPKLPVGNYYTEPKGGGEMIPSGTVIDTSQYIYIYVPSSDPVNCTDNFNFNVRIDQPKIDKLNDITVCEFYTLPVLSKGEYYTSSNGNGTKLQAGNNIFKTQTIYIYLASSVANCSNESSFTITVTQKPIIDSRDNIDVCNFYVLTDLGNGKYYSESHYGEGTPKLIPFGTKITDTQIIYIYAESPTVIGCASENSFEIKIFKLEADAPENVVSCLDYTLPPLTVGNYYTIPGGPTKSMALPAGTKIYASTTLYIYTESGQRQNCSDENIFTITIVDEPIANNISTAQTTVCDEDGVNDGITILNLSQFNASILGSQTSSEFLIEYFASQNDAVLGNNPIKSTDLKKVYAKITNTLTINKCFDTTTINIIVNKIPEPKPIDGIICYDTKTNTLLKSYTINSGINKNLFDIEWQNEVGEILSTNNIYEAVLPGKYTITAINKTTGCSSPKIPVTVTASEPAIVSYSITEDFSNNPSIRVVTAGVGQYEYQLDDHPFQENPLFNNVSSGTHIITVRDKNGCGISKVEAIIINYPKFFTPNYDGFNDTWNVTDLKDYQNTDIQIYDRFGKFLSKITPNGKGWDGTYNGQKMPSTDYWFVINYEKDGDPKIFKAHFSLKR